MHGKVFDNPTSNRCKHVEIAEANESWHVEANARRVAKLLALTKMSVHVHSLEAEVNVKCHVANKCANNGK